MGSRCRNDVLVGDGLASGLKLSTMSDRSEDFNLPDVATDEDAASPAAENDLHIDEDAGESASPENGMEVGADDELFGDDAEVKTEEDDGMGMEEELEDDGADEAMEAAEEEDDQGNDEAQDEGDVGEEEETDERPYRMTTRSRTKRVTPQDSEERDVEEEDESEEDEKAREDHPALLQQQSEGIIHIGSDYQAMIGGEEKSMREEKERDTPMWIPPPEGLVEEELMEFCEEAMGIYMLTFDRALYILQKCNYDYKKAMDVINNRRVVKEEWSEDDCLLFRQAFCMYGKNFSRIRQTMPHRSMASLINHYYSTKKAQDYKALVEARPFTAEKKKDDPALNDDDDWEQGHCENCRHHVDRLYLIDETKQCHTCMLYMKLLQKPRPITGEEAAHVEERRGVKIPHEYMDIVEQFVAMAESAKECKKELSETFFAPKEAPARRVLDASNNSHDAHMNVCVFQSNETQCHQKLREVEKEMMMCRARTVRLEHAIKLQKTEILEKGMDRLRQMAEKEGRGARDDDRGRQRMVYSWTEHEKITAFHCFVRYGRDYEAVADVLGTKTPDMVKSFYSELRPDIDKLIDETEAISKEEADAFDREEMLKIPEAPVVLVDLD